MSNANLNPSQRVAVLAAIAPVSQAAGTVTTGWIDHRDWSNIMAVISGGVLGAGATLDAKVQQAKDNAGTGAKDVTGLAITQMVKATDDNKQAVINVRQDDLDRENGFRFVRLSLTVATAASLVSGLLLGFDPRYGAADAHDATSVKSITG